jgi:hypothetical protein
MFEIWYGCYVYAIEWAPYGPILTFNGFVLVCYDSLETRSEICGFS